MILTQEALREMVSNRFNDSTDERDVEFIENLTDTMSDLYSKANDDTYKNKYLELQDRYKKRFFEGTSEKEDEDFGEEKDYNKLSYDDLFKK